MPDSLPPEDEIARLRVEKDQGASPAGSGCRPSDQAASRLALPGVHPSRDEIDILCHQLWHARDYATRNGFWLSTICPSPEQTDILLHVLTEYRGNAPGIEARQGGDNSVGSVEDESPTRREAPNTIHTHPNPKREDR